MLLVAECQFEDDGTGVVTLRHARGVRDVGANAPGSLYQFLTDPQQVGERPASDSSGLWAIGSINLGLSAGGGQVVIAPAGIPNAWVLEIPLAIVGPFVCTFAVYRLTPATRA